MNCMKYHRIHSAKVAAEEYEKHLQEEQEKMEKMTDEEREAYLAKKKEERDKLMKLLSIPYTVNAMTRQEY